MRVFTRILIICFLSIICLTFIQCSEDNPTNPQPQPSQVQINAFDVLGNKIATLVNEVKPMGTYETIWNAANLPSGVYFYKLQTAYYSAVKKMALTK